MRVEKSYRQAIAESAPGARNDGVNSDISGAICCPHSLRQRPACKQIGRRRLISFPSRSFFGRSLARDWLAKNVEESNLLPNEGKLTCHQLQSVPPKLPMRVLVILLLAGALSLGVTRGFSQGREKSETIEASSMGTGTQLGQMFGITVILYEYSTPEDRQILMQAFEKGKNQGLVNALSKMRAVGHIAITGTLGYDLSYVRMIPTPTGRKIRFVTNRPITFAEAWADSSSQSYNLTGGEFDINDSDKSKNTGVLYPLAQLAIDKQGQLQIELNQNAWTLVDVLDWKGTPGVN